MTGIDVSELRYLNCFIMSCTSLETINLDTFNPVHCWDMTSLFCYCSSLKNISFCEHFSPGELYPLLSEPEKGDVAPEGFPSALTKTVDGTTYVLGSYGKRVRISSWFNGCTALEEIDFANWELKQELAENNNSLWFSTRYYELGNFFKDCKSLRAIRNLDHLVVDECTGGEWSHRYMFDGCESLESIDLSNVTSMIGGPGIFRGCTSLRKLDLSKQGLNYFKNEWYLYTNLKFNDYDSQYKETSSSSVTPKNVNIFEGCDEISEVVLSPYYPPSNKVLYTDDNNKQYPIGYSVSYPSGNRTWIKIAQPDESYYDAENNCLKSHVKKGQSNPNTTETYKYPYNDGTSGKSIKYYNLNDTFPISSCPVNTTLSTEELFCDFQPQYAGTWITVSKIVFNANGSSIPQQAVDGARSMVLNLKEGDLTEPTKNGYTFDGWYYEDEEGVEHKFVNNTVAESWNYYAKWTPNTYNIILHNNETPEQTKTIENVAYDAFIPLSGSTFTSVEEGKILAGWNTQASGNGMDFAANESVDKLTTINGATVDLYAMWRIPDAIVNFDSQGGSQVESRDYTLNSTEPTLYGPLIEPAKEGYTFAGWYTEPNGAGKKIVPVVTSSYDSTKEEAYVSKSCTLYACWKEKPKATFKLQGGNIKLSTEDYVKVVDYGQAIGTVPTPSYGEQTFDGWYTAASGGDLVVNPEAVTLEDSNVTYYAHWGWKPKFLSDGGTITNMPNYATQDDPNYSIGTLPTVTRANYTFDGWYTASEGKLETKISNANNQLLSEYSTSIDLSDTGTVFKAHWTRNATADVTLDPNGGSYTIAKSNVTETVTTKQVYTTVYKGSAIGELPTPTKEHADFAGWYDLTGNTKYTYSSVINSDIELVAHWTNHTCTVTFDPTDGEMAGITEYTLAYGKTFTYLPGANYVDSDGTTSTIVKSFDGWYTEPNGGGTKLTTATAFTGNAKYYANWVDNKISDDKYTSTIRWGTLSSGNVTNVGDTLVFHPTDSGQVAAHLTVDFRLLQEAELPVGSVRITIPKELFLGWNNENVTSVNNTFQNFTADEEGDYFVLTNSKAFKSTNLEPVYYVDPMKVKGGYTDENGVYKDYYRKTFTIKVELKNTETNLFELYQQRDLGVEFHTQVNTKVEKSQSTATLTWNSTWGNKPADADEYFYVVWNLKSSNKNSNQPYQLQWSEGTVHDGSVVYGPALGVWSDEYTSDSSNITQVVTKHPLSEAISEGAWANVYNEAILNVKWKSGYEEQYRSTGKASAFVGETYSTGARSLAKDIPNYGTQSAHYISGGQDMILNSDAKTLGELVFNLSYRENENQDNPGWSCAGEMEIDPRTYVFSDGVKDRKDVLIAGAKDTDSVNKNKWDAADQTQLDDGDYYFTYLDVIINEYDSVVIKDDGTTKHWASPYPNNNSYDYNNVIIKIRTMGSDDFVTFKTIYRSELEQIPKTGTGETGYEDGYKVHVDLPADTVGYQVEYTSHRFITEFKINTAMKLKDTRKLHSLTSTHANAKKHTLIKNRAQVNVKRDNKADYIERSDEFNPWHSTYEFTLSESELYASKSCVNQQNQPDYFVTDTDTSTVEFPVAVSGWTYSKNQLNYIKRVKSGTFHDLLPYGFIVEKDTVKVCARSEEHVKGMNKGNLPDPSTGKGVNGNKSTGYATSYTSDFKFPGLISSNYYSVRFVENWEGSGQTMMIVNINCPDDVIATGFIVYYKCKTTINNLHINGTTPKNYVAFTDTTSEQSLPDSRNYSRDSLDDTSVKAYYASVDTKQTAYAHGTTTLTVPNVYQYGADSTVLTEGADVARHQTVGLNTDYSYNISYEGSTQVKTKSIIIYDVIEKQIGGNTSQWYGNFKSVDISKLKQQSSAVAADGTCAPVVYYLSSDTIAKDNVTKEMLDLNYEQNSEKIWTTTKPANDKVVAVAIDCTKTSSGKNFELGVKKGLDVTIYMNSPDDATTSDIETYNEAIINGKNSDLNEPFSVFAKTSVTLRFMNPIIEKSAFPASGTAEMPESVVMGSVLNYILTITNPDPELQMNDIVMEDVFPLGLVPNNNYTVRFNEGTSISIDSTKRVDYTLTDGTNESNQPVRIFTATINTLDPGETVEITIPVKVNLEKDTNISNEAKITSINGVAYTNLKSNKTYHVVTGVKAKILKVNANGDPLSGATLQIYENNSDNWDAGEGKLKDGATPMQLSNDETSYGTSFTSTNEVRHFDVAAGNYILHELFAPGQDEQHPTAPSDYKKAADIPFTIDVEGIIHVNGKSVNYVEMKDENVFNIYFHENQPNNDDAIFRTYGPGDVKKTENKITHFYDIPEWAGDEYVFAGWYHNSQYTDLSKNSNIDTPSNFESDMFTGANSAEGSNGDYHLYAKWIQVSTIQQKATNPEKPDDPETNDTNDYGNTQIRGFGLTGVQIREEKLLDDNYSNPNDPQDVKPGGLRFVTSLSESLLSDIKKLSNQDAEYGYVVATDENIRAFTDKYNVSDPSKYKLQYNGRNVNGIDTTGLDNNDQRFEMVNGQNILARKDLTAENDFAYVTNVNCTRGSRNDDGTIKKDHKNFEKYRLYTLVVYYNDTDEKVKKENMEKKIDARAYIRYTDANGKVRVFYNNYNENMYYGGCLCSFSQAKEMSKTTETEQG